MLQTHVISYLLWRSSVEPTPQALASRRITAAITLLPAMMAGIFVFGWWAGVVVLVSLFSSRATDWVCHRYFFKDSDNHKDGIWLLSGLLLGLMMPPNVALWVPVLGAISAVFVGKYYLSVARTPLLQPAAIGLLAVTLLGWGPMHPTDRWPVLARGVETSAEDLRKGGASKILTDFFGGDVRQSVSRQQYRDANFSGEVAWFDAEKKLPAQAIHGPRPIDLVAANPARDVSGPAQSAAEGKDYIESYDWLRMLLGYLPATIGGSSGLALGLGVLYLVFSRAVSPFVPLFAMFTLFAGLHFFAYVWEARVATGNIPIHLLTGGTLLGVFYFAADPSTTPRSKLGKIYAGVAIGLFELFFRVLLGMTEGLFISVILVQLLSVVIDQYWAPPKDEGVAPVSGLTSSSLGRL